MYPPVIKITTETQDLPPIIKIDGKTFKVVN